MWEYSLNLAEIVKRLLETDVKKNRTKKNALCRERRGTCVGKETE